VVTSLDPARATYSSAADAFLDLVAPVPLERYTGPGLGAWDLRSLIGHTGRSLVTVATYLTRPAESVAAQSSGEYFAIVAGVAAADDGAIHRRGVDAGLALADDPLGSLRDSLAAAQRALDLLDGRDAVVETAAGGMRVSDYLPTRTFELVVHSLDIARALDAAFEPPPAALAEAVHVATDAVLAQGRGVDVLLALTGRTPLPPDSSVVP
jgi:uncharacterized protein (TIGR03083 family)